ncbi:degenerin mec-4 [Nematostella vectensis]|uniref:degenerin mec-4 n=1 Tax=Nematostella vectensis TaxID=45351 RepID=UPI0020770E45|nr:degenerin mec-4 [Nematostella vectensis]
METLKPHPSVRAIFKDFSDRTSCHGIGQIGGSQSVMWRVSWLMIFLAGLGMVLYQGLTLLDTYLNKPTATAVDITYSEVTNFPSVTICNMNMIKKSQLQHFPQVKRLVDTFNNMTSSNSSLNSSAFMDTNREKAEKDRLSLNTKNSKNKVILNNVNIDMQRYIEDKIVQYLSMSDTTKLMKAGHVFRELVFRCVWNGFVCNKGDFLKYWRPFWHWRYGNCYTFNQGVDVNGTELPSLASSKPGPMYGLTLDLFIDQEQYIIPLSQEAGVKVLLSDQRNIPFPFTHGFTVQPGVSASAGIRQLVIKRIDPFSNGSCYSGNGLEANSIYHKYKGMRYSVQGCMSSCLANNQFKVCNCTEGKFRAKGRPCMTEPEVKCLNNISKKYENGSLGCSKSCPQPCTHYSFRRTISQTQWSDSYEKTFQRLVRKSDRGFANKMNDASILRKNFLRVKLYYEELNRETITYSLSYPVENLLGDVGGQLGLWIGVSVITCAEFLKLLVDLAWYLASKMSGKTKTQVQDLNMQ